MKRNTISFYEQHMKYGPTLAFVPMLLGAVVMFIGFAMCLPSYTTDGFLTLVIGALTLFGNLFLYKSSAYRVLQKHDHPRRMDLWKQYKKMHPDDRRSLPINVNEILDMTEGEAEKLEHKVMSINYKRRELENEKRRMDGRGRVLSDMADDILKDHSAEISTLKSVNKKMDSIR